MKALLKLRAQNIMRTAFVCGLKLEWHSKVIERSLEMASALAARARLMKKSFKPLKKRMLARKNGHTLKQSHL